MILISSYVFGSIIMKFGANSINWFTSIKLVSLKKLLAVLFGIVLLMATGISYASEQRGAQMVEELQQQLNLSDEQIKDFQQINTDFAEQLKLLRLKDASRFSKIRSFKEIAKNKDKQLKSILTEPQYEEYLVIQKEKKAELMQLVKQQRTAKP